MQEIIHGDCLIEMAKMAENSIDFIITDPPYGLHFMGKDWDKFSKGNFDENGKHKHLENASIDGRSCDVRKIASANAHSGTYDEGRNDEFQEFIRLFGIQALRILKPGGHIAMFGAPRRHHRQMSGLEDAGFEIRDCIAWLFGQGFPKSHNFGRKMEGEWQKYGTALKPAYEPIILAMKPLDGTFAQNAEKWGVAGINIDESRIAIDQNEKEIIDNRSGSHSGIDNTCYAIGVGKRDLGQKFKSHSHGRWPANLILDEEAAELLDQQSGISRSVNSQRNNSASENKCMSGANMGHISFGHNDSGGASRFFYCAKASSAERNRGLEGLPLKECQTGCGGDMPIDDDGNDRDRFKKKAQNVHPTVKPLSLMKYLLKLLAPPGDPIVLDPFCGSGSTIVAAKELGIRSIGIEKSEEYCEIARARVSFEKKEKFMQYELAL